MGFNSAFKGLNLLIRDQQATEIFSLEYIISVKHICLL